MRERVPAGYPGHGWTMTKYRVRFTKAGDLRFLSHHDLMRLMERMLRRANLPIAFTEGFHPKPRMQFPSALALGVVGWQEIAEIEFREPLDPEAIRERLAAQALPGMEILSVQLIPRKITGQVVEASYRLALSPDQVEGVSQRLAQLLDATEWIIERKRPQSKRVDIRPFIVDLRLGQDALYMTLRVTPTGSARAEEVLAALNLDGVLLDGGILERTRLVLADELKTPAEQTGETATADPPIIEENGGCLESLHPQKGSA